MAFLFGPPMLKGKSFLILMLILQYILNQWKEGWNGKREESIRG